jgi:hypothetical protein
MIKPGDILLYSGAALLAYLTWKGYLGQSGKFDREQKADEKKAIEKQTREEVQRSAAEFMLSWKDPITGNTRTTNLDTMASYLKAAIRGSWFGEDEEQIRQVMNSIPVSVRGKSGNTYPIRTIAVRYSVQTDGKNLKDDLTKYLSSTEITKLGVAKHLKYL